MKIEQMDIADLEEYLELKPLEEKNYNAIRQRLRDLDPYNDIFHLGCPNWPNCDIAGCGGD